LKYIRTYLIQRTLAYGNNPLGYPVSRAHGGLLGEDVVEPARHALDSFADGSTCAAVAATSSPNGLRRKNTIIVLAATSMIATASSLSPSA
jgi:hypothetical protein